ncbi:XrtB/PEP-CTERM-associated polysaccharide biosynthesis outer membrane protein EpsL [Nitrosospira sp. NpAV]|uniref:XrtB/PEP-CTERM-associated polysaccharide biosynthesis outer membrane protein EpsL n=1 Tax=Nitrosospira sp. NpAV TaxID=58133 RepID=UPI0005A0BF97|nr:XrtB/PEP-CTERM-associated polysaccharide biosynthesis outer membrane protein EpsL [Nitrosospira sp. NpAV]KIO49453.1 hypothetical protein SQ11_07215 [Nitrosospira sp. NpAV]
MLLLNLSLCYRRWLAIAALIMLPLPLSAQALRADVKALNPPPRVLSLSVGTNFMYDSNVFRLSPVIDPVLLTGQSTKADQILVTTAALTLYKNFGQQRIEATGSIVDNRYQNFDFLNFVGKNYTAAWHWRLTPYFHGTLSSSHREALNNFANLTGFVNSSNRNLRTDDNYRFEGIFELTRSWHLLGGVSHTTVRNSRLTVQDFDNKVLSADGGIRYSLPSGTTLTYRVRTGEGDFFKREVPDAVNLFDTRFEEMEHGLQLVWPVTIKTSINARIAHLDRKHDHFHQRDFSGLIGNFDINWDVTSKTRLTASFARELGNFQTAARFQLAQFQTFSSSFAATNRYSLTPIWQITAKTALRLRYDYMTRDFHGAIVPLPTDDRADSQHSGSIILDWQPVNTVSLSASLQRDHRTSNLKTYEYDNIAASITAKLNF